MGRSLIKNYDSEEVETS